MIKPKPSWLKRRLPTGPEFDLVKTQIRSGSLHTVCQEAKCPNIWECFSGKTATFLILGDRCTRNCGFCAVSKAPVLPVDKAEPDRVAAAAEQLGLSYVVVTSVTRDDVEDGGAGMFAQTIRALKQRIPSVKVEVLVPDFKGDAACLRTVLAAGPDVLNHNIETVPRLYPMVRPQADYRRSLDLLAAVGEIDPNIPAKSGLMLGLGETIDEVSAVLADLLAANCRLLTIGQYLQPSGNHLPVQRFVHPDTFSELKQKALHMGFSRVASGPFVRSSYHAREMVNGKGQGA